MTKTEIDQSVRDTIETLAKAMSQDGVTELEYEDKQGDEMRVKLTRDLTTGKPIASRSMPVVEPLIVRSGLVGESAEATCQVGDTVKAEQVVARVKQLGVINEIPAGQRGKVTKILCAPGQPVEWGQPLIELEPASQ